LPLSCPADTIYKWVDQGGITHYSNIEPAGVEAEVLGENRLSIVPGNPSTAESPSSGGPNASDAMIETPQHTGQAWPDNGSASTRRRESMLERCHRHHGVDCEREVDTELRAEALQAQGGLRHLVPPRGTPAPTRDDADHRSTNIAVPLAPGP
jgi:hypothetical protein